MENLKLCPFCGGEAKIGTVTTALEKVPRFRAYCSACWCSTEWDNWSAEEAAGKWNSRAKDDSAL